MSTTNTDRRPIVEREFVLQTDRQVVHIFVQLDTGVTKVATIGCPFDDQTLKAALAALANEIPGVSRAT